MAKHRSSNNTAICTGFMDYVRSMRLGLLCISYFLLYLFYATFLVAQTIFRDFFLARNWSLFWALLNHVTGWNHCTHTLFLSDALLFGNYYHRLWVGVLNSKSRGGEWYLEKRGSRKIWVGSRNISRKRFWSVSKSHFCMVCFTFFESWNFLPKSLTLRFLTRISASRQVSDFTIPHPYT